MKKLLTSITKCIENSNPSTLTGISVFTAWLAAGLMIPATIKAVKKKEKEKPEGILQTVKCVAPCYIPPLASLVVSTGCGIASNSIHIGQNASAIALATTMEHGLMEYKEIAKATTDKNTQTMISQNPPNIEQITPNAGNEIVDMGAPKCICFEKYTKKYFWFAPADLEKIERDITDDLISDDQFPFHQLMWKFGLDPINDNNLGWIPKDYWSGDGVRFEFNLSTAQAPDGRAVLVIDYYVKPHAIDPDSY